MIRRIRNPRQLAVFRGSRTNVRATRIGLLVVILLALVAGRASINAEGAAAACEEFLIDSTGDEQINVDWPACHGVSATTQPPVATTAPPPPPTVAPPPPATVAPPPTTTTNAPQPVDVDGDGFSNANPDVDNCDDVANPDQADLDGDGDGDACDPDIDGDGLLNGYDPTPTEADGDADDDGLSDVDELERGTDPLAADSDGGGQNDGVEVELASNPLDAADDTTTTTTPQATTTVSAAADAALTTTTLSTSTPIGDSATLDEGNEPDGGMAWFAVGFTALLFGAIAWLVVLGRRSRGQDEADDGSERVQG